MKPAGVPRAGQARTGRSRSRSHRALRGLSRRVPGTGAHVQCMGKGRKARCTPLRKDTVNVLRSWLRERQGQPSDPLFPSTRGRALGHDGLAYLLNKHLSIARRHCPSLNKKRVSFHSLRHSLAINLLHHGVDRSVIALWLGHEHVETTSMYYAQTPDMCSKGS